MQSQESLARCIEDRPEIVVYRPLVMRNSITHFGSSSLEFEHSRSAPPTAPTTGLEEGACVDCAGQRPGGNDTDVIISLLGRVAPWVRQAGGQVAA